MTNLGTIRRSEEPYNVIYMFMTSPLEQHAKNSQTPQLQTNLITVYNCGKFDLRKWSSNSEALLENIPPDHRQTDSVTFDEPGSDYTKDLGLKWELKIDTLAYQYLPNAVRFTKRTILFEIARIYDPIGFLTLLTVNLKRIIEYLWSIGLEWDDQILEDVTGAWS